jgi:hypothetical protein
MDIREVVRGLAISGTPIETANELLRTLANANGCVPDLEWALKEAEAIYSAKGRRVVQDAVREYVESSAGWFTHRDMDMELQYVTPQDKTARRVALLRLVKEGVLERHRSKDGMYRRVESGLQIIDWQNADMTELDIKWPFELEKWEISYPGTLDVIAGSSGAGKTAFMLNFIALNQTNHMIRYMTSEMSAQQLKHRLGKFTDVPEWCFEPIRCSSNFADKILPASVNVIDYLEVDGENPSGVVNELRDIFDALTTGFVLVGLQKKGHTHGYKKDGSMYSIRNDLGRGGAFSMEKARLYLSMDYNELTVVKSSNRRNDDDEPLRGRRWGFYLYRGCFFENVEELERGQL